MKNGKTQTAMMNYNMITEEMIFENGSTRLAMDNLETIDTVYLDSRRFVPHDKIFHEVLINDRISLFKKHKSNLLQSGSLPDTAEHPRQVQQLLFHILGSGAMYKLQSSTGLPCKGCFAILDHKKQFIFQNRQSTADSQNISGKVG